MRSSAASTSASASPGASSVSSCENSHSRAAAMESKCALHLPPDTMHHHRRCALPLTKSQVQV
jgi:hypothetical protein